MQRSVESCLSFDGIDHHVTNAGLGPSQESRVKSRLRSRLIITMDGRYCIANTPRCRMDEINQYTLLLTKDVADARQASGGPGGNGVSISAGRSTLMI